MDKILFGAAYYYEYMPYERLSQDIAMMKKAGINTVRIAESTWSTYEPQEGVFDFSPVIKVMDAMEEAGINVIIGTPTYAIPTWMVKSHPDVLAVTKNGREFYGHRQNMDITNPAYLFYCERIIRKLMEVTAKRKCVIGFQLDNETHPYGTAGKNVQERFVKYLREKFNDDLDAINHEFGFDYWSNRINAWEDFPDVRGTINGSLGAEFEKFQRMLVTEFLGWQAGIVREYKREDQFITHNFDYEWFGFSYGMHPEVDQHKAAECLDISGTDIYHPTQDDLTGEEIAFGGNLMRSLKRDNYLVLETQAQGYPLCVPYKGQLRLQAYSHIASGANSVMYWHWHSIHNSAETYWKGLLGHDFKENPTYLEACGIGRELGEIGEHLVNLKKKNDVAILVSSEALTALKWFGIEATAADNGKMTYNGILRWIHDTLYRMNVECDFIWPEFENFSLYKVIIVPALYAVKDSVLERLNKYVEEGGILIATFKTGFADEYVKVSHEVQPRIINKCLGVTYNQFVFPKKTKLCGEITKNIEQDFEVNTFMELLNPDTADVLAYYDHYNWKEYAAVTENKYGMGSAFYIGCKVSQKALKYIFGRAFLAAGINTVYQYPVIIKQAENDFGKKIRFYFNYSCEEVSVVYCNEWPDGISLLDNKEVKSRDEFFIEPWGIKIIEEK